MQKKKEGPKNTEKRIGEVNNLGDDMEGGRGSQETAKDRNALCDWRASFAPLRNKKQKKKAKVRSRF